VPVAHEVAQALHVPLDVFVVRKLGVPGHEKLAMGAIASGGVRVVNESIVRQLGLATHDIDVSAANEQRELERREVAYRDGRPAIDVAGKVVIVVDDGLATGSTMKAAVAALRNRGPARIVVAVPTASRQACEELAELADEVVCSITPSPFYAVGMSYENFSQTTDAEVRDLLHDRDHDGDGDGGERVPVLIPVGALAFEATAGVPRDARGVVLFAHGSGSSRHSPRNLAVAEALERAGLATVLVDLLTAEEDEVDQRTRALRFDVELLATRLGAMAAWLHDDGPVASMPLGLFGASTGAAAALVAAARRPDLVGAVVSRGGRPDLAGDALRDVVAPALFIVGGRDEVVLDLNRAALAELGDRREMVVVPNATHLFEEPGALDEVARLAANWFLEHLR